MDEYEQAEMLQQRRFGQDCDYCHIEKTIVCHSKECDTCEIYKDHKIDNHNRVE